LIDSGACATAGFFMDKPGFNKHALFVGEGVNIEGKIDTDGHIEVHGLVSGDVTAGEVLIAASGRIDGTIKASRLEISGFAGSSIDVTERLLVRATGRVDGDVIYGSVQIEAGASIFGTIRQQNKLKPDRTAKDKHFPDNAAKLPEAEAGEV
jgi:cytoskeletal protein CcmA (bactofilin family)